MGIADGAPADPQDHRAVPRHQRRKGSLVAVADEALQQRRIGRAGRLMQVTDEVGDANAMRRLLGAWWLSTMIVPWRWSHRTRICDGHARSVAVTALTGQPVHAASAVEGFSEAG